MTIQPERRQMSLYVDRSLPSWWVVRDPDGDFWLVPPGDQGWERRQPYALSEGSLLEPVPGHYKYLLGIAG